MSSLYSIQHNQNNRISQVIKVNGALWSVKIIMTTCICLVQVKSFVLYTAHH